MTTVTISISLEEGNSNEELIRWLTTALGGSIPEPIVEKKARKPRKPMTAAQKKALKERLAEGKRKAAEARGEALQPKPARKPASKTAAKKTTTRKPAAKSASAS